MMSDEPDTACGLPQRYVRQMSSPKDGPRPRGKSPFRFLVKEPKDPRGDLRAQLTANIRSLVARKLGDGALAFADSCLELAECGDPACIDKWWQSREPRELNWDDKLAIRLWMLDFAKDATAA